MILRHSWTYRLLLGLALTLAPMVPAGCGDDDGAGTGGGTGGGAGGGTGGGAGGGTGGGGGALDGGELDGALADTSVCTALTLTTCTVACTDFDSCTGTVVCPAGYDCTFTCVGDAACDDVVLDCATNANASCAWSCNGAAGTCDGTSCSGDGCQPCTGAQCPL